MAINLNPGADPTLVSAAYRAAMANVPKDLSGTFEAMAKNYAITMQTLGAVWGGVAKNITGVAKEAIDRAVEVKNYEARGLKYQNKDGVSFLTDSLDNIKNELYGTWTGDPFSRESRAERIRLRQKRDKIFGQIDMLDAGVSSLGDVLTSGQFDGQATGLNNMRFVNAAQAFSTSSGKTKEGDYLVPSYDENDDITLTLYDKTGKAVAKDDGSFITYKPSEIDGLLVRDNPQLLGSGNKLFENLETQGYKYGGEYSFAGKKFRRGMGELVKNGNNLHNAMNKDFYHLGKSFMDDLTSPDGSLTSASIFGMLNNELPVDSKGNPLPITDFNNSGGIDAGDFASEENMLLIQTALTDKTSKYYDEDVTRDVFLDWTEMQGKAAFDYGKGRRVPKGETNDIQLNPFAKGGGERIDVGDGKTTYVDNVARNNRRRDVMNIVTDAAGAGTTFVGTLANYEWDKNSGLWKSGKNTYETIDLMKDEKIYFAGGVFESGLGGGDTDDEGDNPFGGTQANRAPADFVAAVGKDDKDVVTYLENMGITVTNKLGDKVEVEINGKKKTFTVDPNIASDEARANEMWKWMFENWEEFIVGNEYSRGGKTYIYQKDGTFKLK